MGGFRLQGPNYKIISLPSTDGTMCKCMGYRGMIDEDIETMLVEKEDKTLILYELPLEVQFKLRKSHLGENMMYRVEQNTEAERNVYLNKPKKKQTLLSDVYPYSLEEGF
jgi:hypothetical protein